MNTRLVASRRSILNRGLAGGLLVSLGLPEMARGQGLPPASHAMGAFLRIGTDGSITVIAPCVEMGQGSHTALAMIIADELGADWSQVSVLAAPLDPVYHTPGRPMQNTSGSQMVRRWNVPLRKSAAAAREMLISAAAERWNISAAECRAARGVISHEATGRRLNFRDVIVDAIKLPEPRNPVLSSTLAISGWPDGVMGGEAGGALG